MFRLRYRKRAPGKQHLHQCYTRRDEQRLAQEELPKLRTLPNASQKREQLALQRHAHADLQTIATGNPRT